MKICRICGMNKPLSEFYQRKHGQIGHCKLCELAVNHRYIKSEHGAAVYKRVRQRYDASEKGKQKYSRYRKTDKRKEVTARDSAKRRAIIEPYRNDFTLDDWNKLLDLYDHRCAYCLRQHLHLSRDHVIPLAKGGHHTKDNIVPACHSCNSRKHTALWQPVKAS